ncbi:hypothetical protein XPA_007750 [Xanthoria parietina]
MDDIPFAGRITYQVTALIALTILSLMAGSRITALKEAYYRRLGFVHVLVFAIYAIGLFFIFATNLMLAGWHFGEAHICRAGAYLCLACYVSFKALLYLYLVDRVHATREDRHGRKMAYLDDYVCLVLYVLVISGVVVIYAFAFLYPVAYTGITRKCIVGLPPWIAISLLSLDSALSVLLTAILWYLIQKSTGKKTNRPDLPPGSPRPPLLRSEPALGGPGRPAPRAIHDGLQGRAQASPARQGALGHHCPHHPHGDQPRRPAVYGWP